MDTPKPQAKLHPWTPSFEPEEPDAECSHCGAPFVAGDGMVTEGFSLCPVCDARD
jgi:formylmethanofuran dehydrogenase subunit E